MARPRSVGIAAEAERIGVALRGAHRCAIAQALCAELREPNTRGWSRRHMAEVDGPPHSIRNGKTSSLSDEVCENWRFQLQFDAGILACLNAFEQPGHLVADVGHGLHAFGIFGSLTLLTPIRQPPIGG